MRLFNLFKKRKNIELIDKVNQFNYMFNSIFVTNNIINDDDINYIKVQYKELFNNFSIMQKNKILREYCKKNGVQYDEIVSFINSYSNLEKDIINHNEKIKAINEQKEKNKVKNDKYNLENICKTIFKTYTFLNIQMFHCGPEKLVKYLRGAKLQQFTKIIENDHNFYNIYCDITHDSLFNIIDWLIQKEVFAMTDSFYPVLKIKNDISIIKEKDYENSDISIDIFKKENKVSKKENEGILTQKIDGYDFVVDENGEILTDIALFKLLKQKRKELANRDTVDLFIVAWNKVLINLATYKPASKEEYVKVPYCSDKTYEIYGFEFVGVIKKYLDNNLM